MLKTIFNWFRQPDPKAFAPAVQPEAAPYKVEPPQVAVVAEPQSVAPSEPAKQSKPRRKPAAKKAPAAAMTAAKKPRTKKSS